MLKGERIILKTIKKDDIDTILSNGEFEDIEMYSLLRDEYE